MIINTLSEKKTFSDEQISTIYYCAPDKVLHSNHIKPFKEPFPYRLQLVIATVFSPSQDTETLEETIIVLKMGPFLLDWNETGIASFRSINMVYNIYAIIDLYRLISYEDLPQLQKIIKVWNRFYVYSDIFCAEKARIKKSGNSYAFINTILNILVYKKWWSNNHSLAKYLKKIKKYNYSGYPSFNGQFIRGPGDHQYYHNYNYKSILGKEDIELLKAFDRGFRFNGSMDPTTCPFRDIPEREANGPPENYILNISTENEELSVDVYNNSKALKDFI